MSISRLLVSILLVPTTGLFAQGAGYFETKRVEDAALAHARRMKAAKEAALEEPAPRDLNPPKPMPASALQARALGPSAEPLYFQVVTPQGLVPLDQWQAAQQPRKPSGAPSASGSTAPPAKGQPAPESSEVARGRTIRLAFLGVGNGRENAVEKGAAEGRAVSLEAAEPVKPQVGETAKPGRVAAGVKAPARAEVSPVPARAAAPVPVVSPEPVPAPDDEVVAVMEEIPSLKTGGEPKRRLLGFMSGKGVEAALMTAEAPSVAGSEKPAATVEDRPPEARRVPAVERVVKESQPAPVPPQHEEKLAAAPPGAPRETFLNGVGQWLAAARPEVPKVEPPKPGKVGSVAEPKVEPKVVAQAKASDGGPEKPVSAVEDRPPETRRAPGGEVAQAVGSPAGAPRETFLNGVGQWLASVRLESQKVDAVEGKKVGAGRPVAAEKPSTPTGTKFSGDAAVAAGYFATNLDRVAFHVIEAGPGETHKMELEAGTVGRKHGEGDEWAWLQLDSGLMGLVKKRQLRPAVGGEVVAFLSAESKNGKKSGKSGTEVRYVEVELPASPEAMPENDQALENPLFASGISPAPVATPEVSPPAPEMAASPAVSPPAPTAVAPVPAVLKSLPLQGALGPAGVITVPSPVPILP